MCSLGSAGGPTIFVINVEDRVPNRAYGDTGGARWIAQSEKLMNLRSWLAALFAIFVLAGCTSVAAGQGQGPNAPYQQHEPRDISGMH